MGGSSKKQTVGYRYYMGLHFGICHGPVDALSEIRVGDRRAWPLNGEGEITYTGEIFIDAPELFGGDKREGGVKGAADVMGGEPGQGINTYLKTRFAGDYLPGGPGPRLPNFRGILSLLYKGGLISANNPYVKPWAFKVRRILAGWGGKMTSENIAYANYVLNPWASNAPTSRDPRACDNDHEYRRDVTGSAWSDFDTVKAQMEAAIGRPLSSTPIGWTTGFGQVAVAPYEALDPGDREQLGLRLNDPLVESLPSEKFLNLQNNQLENIEAAGIDFDELFWMRGASIPGIYVISATRPTSPSSTAWTAANNYIVEGELKTLWVLRDQTIRVRRKLKPPNNPCAPDCQDPYPADPSNPGYCLADGQSLKDTDWSLVGGAFKALSLYALNGSNVQRRPLNPVLKSDDPSYSSEQFWTAAYNGAVQSSALPPGMTYNAGGSGGASTYPRTMASAWEANLGTIVEGDPWEPGIAAIGDDMNPAHIIYQCLTNAEWGMGYPVASIDEDAFLLAAQALYDEEFGLSLLWNQQAEIGGFIQEVLNHCGAVLYADPRSGKFALALIRGDYDPEELEVYDPSNVITLESFQRVGYGETVNEITVVYVDGTTDKDAAITIQDLANIQAQGGVVAQTRQYPGIRNATLASRVAERDLIAGSTPLAKARIRVNRNAWSKRPGQVIKLDWPKLGLYGVIFRVLSINYGTLTDGAIAIELAEDVFGLPDSSYVGQEQPGWVEPDNTPDDVDPADVFEAPYYDVQRELAAADLDYTDPDAAYMLTLGAQGNSAEQGYNIYARVDAGEYELLGVGVFAATAVLSGEIDQAETEINFTAAESVDTVEAGTRAMIGTGASAEFVLISDIDAPSGSMTVARGILDTTPQSHNDGARIWFIDDSFGIDVTERATGEDLDYKLTAYSTAGQSPLADATELPIVPAQRFYRPYAPGNVLINDEAFPVNVTDGLTITWSHRDRLQQTAYFVEQDEADIGPEPGVSYSLTVYDDLTEDILFGPFVTEETTVSTPIPGVYERLRLELYSTRDGVDSWQKQIRRFAYEFLEGDSIQTEDGLAIVTTDNIYIVSEDTEESPEGPTYPYTKTLSFSGTFNTNDQFVVSISNRVTILPQLFIDTAGHSSLDDLAIDLETQLATQLGVSAEVTRSGATVTIRSNIDYIVYWFNNSGDGFGSLVQKRQEAMPIQVGSNYLGFVDLYQFVAGTWQLSPFTAPEYNASGSAKMKITAIPLTWEAEKAYTVASGGGSTSGGFSFNWTVSVALPPGSSIGYWLGFGEFIDDFNDLAGLSAIGFTAADGNVGGGQTRSALAITGTGNASLFFEPVAIALESSHPSGYRPAGMLIQPAVADLPSGAKELWTIIFAGVERTIFNPPAGWNAPTDADGIIFTVTIDSVDYTYTGTTSETTSADIAAELAGVLPAGYTVTHWNYRGGLIEVENDTVNTPFDFDARCNYGIRLELG